MLFTVDARSFVCRQATFHLCAGDTVVNFTFCKLNLGNFLCMQARQLQFLNKIFSLRLVNASQKILETESMLETGTAA